MANRPPPLFALSTVQEILRSYDKPITMGVIERELNLRHVEKLDSHKLKQRIHVLVHSGKIKAEPDSLDSRVRWYSLPDVTPPAPVKVEAAEPAPMEPPAPAEIVPVIDLKGTVNAIADAVAAAIGDVLRTRIEAVVHDQLQQALDSLPTQITQVIADPKGTVRTLNPGPVQAPKAPGKTRITIVGLLAGQAQMIYNEYGTKLALEFVEQTHATGQRLKSLCASSKAVLTMTGFISHSTEDLIKSRGGNLIRVTGGMSSLRSALDTFVTEGEKV